MSNQGHIPAEIEPTYRHCDVLVLGTGIAACQAAIAAAREGAKVLLVGHARGASPFILGFNVPLAASLGDSAGQFEEDTYKGGYSLGNRTLIGLLAREAPIAYEELVQAGVPFERSPDGPALRHLSGSRFPRSVFVKAGTGTAIYRALLAELETLGVARHTGLRVLQLVTCGGRVSGAIASGQDGSLHAFNAGSTVVALGGIGGLYENSTYPSDVIGDGLALALEVGATLIDMEFVQFEPTVVLQPERVRGMEMPTAMLGDGATLLNDLGERFMLRYNPENGEKVIEKAKMALFIQREIDEGRGTRGGGVWFDATMLSDECLRGYETHYRRLVGSGVDPILQPVEIRPAAHSIMGGIRIDERCCTGIPGLLACGEAAGGLHGASRIAGNGASDAVVISRVAGRTAAAQAKRVDEKHFREAVQILCTAPRISDVERAKALVVTVSRELSTQVGICRNEEGLISAIRSFESIEREIAERWDGSICSPYAQVHRAVSVAQAIARSALLREESRGAHYRVDFPEIDDAWTCSITVQRQPDGILAVVRGNMDFEVITNE
ncbi:FAD-binding protein [Pseudomonas psychrophila]|uniref:FAD-binding protein n=1 Tax=Pseudomonas psychrophila TaxID=122355 RepID=UPI00380BF51B